MELDSLVCYRAVQARDARYDGRFFTCVKTTGIYCRPICPARPPKLENCQFVATAAAAQEASFRPCLRCRPENSPSIDAWRGTEATVSRALRLIEEGALDQNDVSSLAERLGVGERHLRRLFSQHVGAAPVTVAQTRRLLLAKQLIHQTALPMIDVALASGFGSVRRFNEAFQRLYGKPPSALRSRAPGGPSSPELSLLIPYRPPYDWGAMLGFLQRRAIAGLEAVSGDTYRRVISLAGPTGQWSSGTLSVEHAPDVCSLRVTVRLPRLDLLPAVLTRVRRQFDTAADPAAIHEVLSADPLLRPLVESRPGLRVPGTWDPFEAAVRAILGQQVTVTAGMRLVQQVVHWIGDNVAESTGSPELKYAFPRAEQFAPDKLLSLGVPRPRQRALLNLAAAVQANPQWLASQQDLPHTIDHLSQLPGIGEWTAQYIALRGLGESDAFLAGDVGLQNRLTVAGQRPTAAEMRARSNAWRPWRAYATIHLWTAEPASVMNTSIATSRETA
jgi:AraC family transcriptional regulator of adaptative response / DNA-3-methyladenine glycosylase II